MAVHVVSTFTSVYLGFLVNLIYEGCEPGHLHNMRRKTYCHWISFILCYVCLSLLQKISLHKAYIFFLGDEDYVILSLEDPGEGILFNTVSSLENCLEVNNANCDLGMMGDLNLMEHLNQATEAPLLVNKARENEEHN